MGSIRAQQRLDGPGLRPLLQSHDFGDWDAVVAQSLGHHRSRLLPGSVPFHADIRAGTVEEFAVLLLQGRGQVELLREQCGHGVLWLPLQGLSHEVINGVEHLAEPGMGLLFRPGDAMCGRTSESIRGVSILVPEACLPTDAPRSASPLLHQGTAAQRLMAAAWRLAATAAHPPSGAAAAAETFADALQQWGWPSDPGDLGISAERRRGTVVETCRWMERHLAERFTVSELSRVTHVSVRTLQYSFQQELGCTPMAQAKRLRLRQLRRLLQMPDLATRGIGELMEACGLLACGVTAADYRQWCGETPRRTRQQALE